MYSLTLTSKFDFERFSFSGVGADLLYLIVLNISHLGIPHDRRKPMFRSLSSRIWSKDLSFDLLSLKP